MKQVLERARRLNLKLNNEKSHIAISKVNYVGHSLTGLKPTTKRVRAITKMKASENLAELETVLGMIACIAKFIPNLSDLNALNKLK